ncbi:hypothetical protein C8Q77DRAFT_1212862 [Trametes polyzona]|nr:hypothetical protein C8Q77DRAFT_1212862 [Trametes polyzona]
MSLTVVTPEDFLGELVSGRRDQPMPASLATTFSHIETGTTERGMSDSMKALNGAHAQAADRDRTIYPLVDWSRMEVAIVVSPDPSVDPYDDGRADGVADTDEGRKMHHHVLQCGRSILCNQHRTCLYLVLVVGDNARLLRTDSAGGTVTSAFRYKTHVAPLMEFFWRFSRLSAEERGVDTTARRLSDDPDTAEADKALLTDMQTAVENFPQDYRRELFGKSIGTGRPLWLLTLDDERTKTRCGFIVGKQTFQGSDLTGRSTHGYVAYDCNKTRLVYLKDTWRSSLPSRMKHQHYRLVVEEIGRPLSDFESAKESVFAIYTALEAHHAAYKLNIIHGDVSVGNILLVIDPASGARVGMSSGWKLARDVTEGALCARQQNRVGTWQFLSSSVGLDWMRAPSLQDDLESIVPVLLYMALRFLPHNLPPGYSCGFMKTVLPKYGIIDVHRLDWQYGPLQFWWSEKERDVLHPIDGVLYTLLQWFAAYYASVDAPRKSRHGPKEDLEEDFAVDDDSVRSGPSANTSSSTNLSVTADAEKLKNHQAMRRLLLWSLSKSNKAPWPQRGEYKTADKVERPYDCEEASTEEAPRGETGPAAETSRELKRSARTWKVTSNLPNRRQRNHEASRNRVHLIRSLFDELGGCFPFVSAAELALGVK